VNWLLLLLAGPLAVVLPNGSYVYVFSSAPALPAWASTEPSASVSGKCVPVASVRCSVSSTPGPATMVATGVVPLSSWTAFAPSYR
jgi:hypothetical protein